MRAQSGLRHRVAAGLASVCVCVGWAWPAAGAAGAATPAPETVTFASADRATTLTGYLWRPAGTGPFPAVVMLHGRAGPYSSAASGVYDASTLSARHRAWGEFWAARGYVALHVDSFGPRGYPRGFPLHSYQGRPPAVSEQKVRPLDANGALAYLIARGDVLPGHVGVQGWSNGGMTVLAALGADAPAPRFRAAIAFYPGCRAQEQAEHAPYAPYAPLLLLLASDDEEVSPERCRRLAERSASRGGGIESVIYPGAQHAFDDPGPRKQAHAANRTATQDAQARVQQFFARHLAREATP